MVPRCTKKQLAVIGRVRLTDLAPARNDQDWYANLLWCEGRPGLLLTHAGTLFAIFEADVGAAELRATGSIVSSLFRRERINELTSSAKSTLRQSSQRIQSTSYFGKSSVTSSPPFVPPTLI